MSGQSIGAAVGGVIGFVVSGFNPAGFQLGAAIGGTLGGLIAPTKINGPKLGDGQQQTSTDGVPIAWVVAGVGRVAGTLVQSSTVRSKKIKDSGKGGPEVSHNEGRQDFCIQVCESSATRDSVMTKVVMVEQDGKIVYDVRSGKSIGQGVALPDTYVFNLVKALTGYNKWAANITFQYGAETQLPHPTLEAVTGVGNTPSYRGTLTMVATDFNITSAGGRIPSFMFTVAKDVYTSLPPSVALTASVTAGDFGLGAGKTYVGAFYSTSYTVSGAVDSGTRNVLVSVSVPPVSGLGGSMAVRWILRDSTGAAHSGTTTPCDGPILFDSKWIGPEALRSKVGAWVAANKNFDSVIMANTAVPSTSAYRIDSQFSSQAIVNQQITLPQSIQALRPEFYYFQVDNYSSTTFFIKPEYVAVADLGDPKPSTLAETITRICLRGGLTVDDIDVADLTDIEVLGYTIAKQCNGVEALAPLLQAYFCYATEYDGKIHFRKYGADAVMTIDERDLMVDEDSEDNDHNVLSTERAQPTEYPAKITVGYADPAQNYMPVTVSSPSLAGITGAIGEESIGLSVVMPPDQAKQAAAKALKIAYAVREGTQKYRLPFAGYGGVYLTLVAGDAVLFRGKRWGIDRITISQSHLEFETHRERQSAFQSNVQAVRGNLPPVPSLPYSGPTTLYAANLPSLRPQDTYGIYLGAASTTNDPNWQGAQLQASYDGQLTWVNAIQMVEPSVLGTVALDEPVGGEPLTVSVQGDLFTVTDAQISANANAFAILHAAGDELGQFKTATEDAETADQYALTDVTRGGLGTTQQPAVAGEKFMMLDSVYFLPIDKSFAGKTIYLRAVGFGEVAESASVISIVYQALGPTDIGGGTPPASNARIDVDGNGRIDVDGNRRVTY